MRIVLAFRAFFSALFSAQTADGIRAALEEKPASKPEPAKVEEKPKQKPKPAKPTRSEAVALLAALQREARFVDIVSEPLGDYSDAQIGAAARDVLRDCKTVLDRIFGLEPIVKELEGDTVETPEKVDPAVYKLAGNVQGDAPFRGKLVHSGWKVAKCELPQWSGDDKAAKVIAPVEIEL